MVADTELLPDDRGNALGRPDVPEEPEGFGAVGKQAGELCELFGCQPGCWAGGRLAVQSLGASFARPLQPPADRALETPKAAAMAVPCQPC